MPNTARAWLPLQRRLTMMACLVPGAHAAEGRTATSVPVCAPTIAFVASRCAQETRASLDVVGDAIHAAMAEGSQGLPAGVVDITPYLAERMGADA